jgi:hypothetical protein
VGLLLLVLTVPTAVEAQSYTNSYGVWTYETTNGTITITGYSGSGGDVTIPDTINGLSVTSMGRAVFWFLTNLSSLSIPSVVVSIDAYNFLGCSSLTAITVDALNSFYSSVDGVLFNKNQTVLVRCPPGQTGAFFIPSSVTNIGYYAFSSCTMLTNISIPSGVTSIGEEAFNSCIGLTDITIPGSVTTVGGLAST